MQARGQSGLGLGLALVNAIARAHGGSVQVVSEEGVGSTFRLLIPLDEPPSTPNITLL